MTGLVIAALFIVLNGFFVAAEFSLVKVRATQLHSRVKKGERAAILAQEIIGRLDRYLAVTQFGITLASLGLGWVGEPAVTALVDQTATALFGHALGEASQFIAAGLAFGALTLAHVLLGEQVPKLIAIQRSEAVAVFSAIPLRVVCVMFWPLLWVLEMSSRVILRAMGLPPDSNSEGALSEDEILGILLANTSRSPSGKEKNQLLERVLRFSVRTARHAMVPRVDVVFIPIEESGATACHEIRTHEYSRVILTRGRSFDDVAGYLYAKDFLLDPHAQELGNLQRLRRDVLFVAETQGLLDVLRVMQKKHVPIAVVVDEYGGTSGIITMEDLLEEIVGEIRDEFDEEPARVTRATDELDAWDVDQRAVMEDLRVLGIVVDEREAAEPVGAIAFARLGRLPRAGDRVELGGSASAEITGVSRRRVTRMRVRVKKSPESTE